MDDHTLRVLEYNKIIEELSRQCLTIYGKEKALKLRPSQNAEMASHLLAQTTEARSILNESHELSFPGIKDIRNILKKAEKQSALTPLELHSVGTTLYGIRMVKKGVNNLEQAPILKGIASQIDVFVEIEKAIENSVTEAGEILDTASSKLASIRRKMKIIQDRIKNKFDTIIKSSDFRQVLQEPILTIRNGRYVVPVKSEKKDRLPGIVHDSSKSGATIFVEPMAVVRLNNELRELSSSEEKEIHVILMNLTAMLCPEVETIRNCLLLAGEIDFIFGKARLSIDQDASEPMINNDNYINLISARHPLLGDNVVPVSIYIGKDYKTLIITGPNTGGKTVTLKTTGLFTLMGQSGLHIPCLSGSQIGCFKNVYADIGDEQSIEQNLSTFSSHMRNIVNLCKNASEKSLVLLDELGAGTDPAEGSVLGMAILKNLSDKGATTVATTHYGELKEFAYSNAGIENASVEFDIKTLSPTYTLNIGLPGRSNAFIIAARLGLDEDIIETAKSFMSEDKIRTDDLIGAIEEDRRASKKAREESKSIRQELTSLKGEYLQKLKKLEEDKGKIMAEAREESLQVLKKAKDTAGSIVADLRGHKGADPQLDNKSKSSQKELDLVITDLEEASKKDGFDGNSSELEHVDGYEQENDKKLAKGDMVHIKPLAQDGEIIDAGGDEGKITVQAGALRLSVDVKDVYLIEDKTLKKQKDNISVFTQKKAGSIKGEISVRGLIASDALEIVDKYMDEVTVAGLSRIRIIHGKGTGKLCSVIRQYLRKNANVKSYEFAPQPEGGSGVTVVYLK